MGKKNIYRIIAIIIVILMWGGIYIRKVWQKTIIMPGNPVLYHGKIHDIEMMEIDIKTNKSQVRLKNSNVMISSDSVTNPYKPFWRF